MKHGKMLRWNMVKYVDCKKFKILKGFIFQKIVVVKSID